MANILVDESKLAHVLNEGRIEQQHKLEKLAKSHLVELMNVECKTELEKVMQAIIRQYIDAVKSEAGNIAGFKSIYME